MNWTIEHDQPQALVSVTTSGTLDLPQLNAMSADAIAVAMRLDLHRFLIDHRGTMFAIRAAEALECLPVLRAQGLPRMARVALIYAVRDAELFRFFEDAAANRGFQIRVFTDPVEAVRWLIR